MDRRTFLKATAATSGAMAIAPAAQALATPPPRTAGRTVPAGHWDTVPTYGHMGKATPFTGREIHFLVDHFPTITISKFQGESREASTEQATRQAFDQIKAANPTVPVSYVWNAAIDWVTRYRSTIHGLPDDWTLKTSDGTPWVPRTNQEIDSPNLAFDTSNPDLRDWWVWQVVEQVVQVGYDGVFVDAINFYAHFTDKLAAVVGKDKQEAVTAGLSTMLMQLRTHLPVGTTLMYNGIRSDPGVWDGGLLYLDRADAIMLEGFGALGNSAPDRMAQDMDLVAQADAMGKIVAFCGSPHSGNPQPAPSLADGITFPLAAFLCCAGPNTFFRYGAGWRADGGPLVDFPELNKPLGPPAGPATRSGYTYQRTFAHAQVEVDLETLTGRIDWD